MSIRYHTHMSTRAVLLPVLTRRTFLRGAAAAVPLSFLWRRRARANAYGALVPDPDGLLDLPEGFSYRVIDRRGDIMSDGYRVPGAPDGMACIAGPAGTNTLILMRNHELANGGGGWGPLVDSMPYPEHFYDGASQGGVTRIVLDATTLEPVSSNLVLYGTIRNCGGGASPWGWLTCEEDVSTNHGYVFLCPTTAGSVAPPQRIVGYGRMNHEAAVVDPVTRIAYLTEDRPDSCLYRFVPDSPTAPFEGRLQALRVNGEDNFDTSARGTAGASWSIEWVDVTDPDPSDDSCRVEAQDRGAATISRGEGAWFHGGSVYFCATDGGALGNGQVMRLDPDGDGGTLTVIAQCEDPSVLDYPDNITVAPWGEVFLCEDGDGQKHLRILGADGTVSNFARNAASDHELAGICFSPDGTTLFVNMLMQGVTLAITGPFPVVETPDDPGVGADPDLDGATDLGRGVAVGGLDGAGEPGGCSAGSGGGLGTAAAVVAAAAVIARRAR
jgi:secreted PhoX family phosphatase